MAKSRRALHWAESRHPRDNRGRFARKGGSKWFERVGESAKASFVDINLGYESGRGPTGRLQTGKGGLIDTAALSRAAPRMQGPARPPETKAAPTTKRPEFLKIGERFKNAQGVEHEVTGVPSSGRRAGQQVTRVQVRRLADGKTGPVTLDKPVEMVDRDGVEAPKVGRTATGKVDTPRVSGQTGGMTNAEGGNFADDLRKEMGSQNDLAKATARGGRTPAGAKLPTTAGGNIDPKPARTANREARAANLDKARTAQRERRADELRASREPKDNGAKIRALQNETITTAELYRRALAGPSGQRTNLMIGRVSYHPNSPSGEFRITDRDGHHAGWATRTVRKGEPVYVFHSEGPQGEQRLEGWAESLAVGVDVLNNGHHEATGYGTNSMRTSGGHFERYAGRNKSIEELDRDALNREIQGVRERLANPDLTPGLRQRAEAELARLEEEKRPKA